MLKKWIKTHGYSISQFAREVDISRQALYAILDKKTDKIFFSNALNIKKLTGLYPWDYSPKFKTLKKIYEKSL